MEELHVVRGACLIICSREYLWQNKLYWLTKLVLGMQFCIAWFSLRIYLPLWKRLILKSPSKNISLSRLMSSRCLLKHSKKLIQVGGLQIRPLLVESSVIVIFYSIFLMRYAVIINYYFGNFFFPIKRKEGVSNCFKPLISSVFTTVASRLKSEQNEKEK